MRPSLDRPGVLAGVPFVLRGISAVVDNEEERSTLHPVLNEQKTAHLSCYLVMFQHACVVMTAVMFPHYSPRLSKLSFQRNIEGASAICYHVVLCRRKLSLALCQL
jgi:hypothetical protein